MKFVKVLLTAAVLFVSAGCSAQNFDIDLLKSINQNETGFKNHLSRIVSKSVTPVNIAAPVTLLAIGLANHDKNLVKNAAYMAGGCVVSIFVTQGAKRIIQRNRPYKEYAFILKRDDGANGYSFPSGHSSAAFYSATSLSLLYPKWYVIAPSYLWASTVAWSRMYQGVHYPSDVLVGALVGAGTAWATYKVQQWMDKKATVKHTIITPSF